MHVNKVCNKIIINIDNGWLEKIIKKEIKIINILEINLKILNNNY